MIKVGILTFHFADNFGAVLQAYALNKAINSIRGCESMIIDYVPPGFQYEHRWANNYEKMKFFSKRKLFERFLRDHCTLTERCDCIDSQAFDIYCIGSDQLWNTAIYYRDYFLYNIPEEKKKISFATSISLANDSPYLLIDPFKKYIPRFSKVSVREEESVHFIESVAGVQCSRMCDPTILVDDDDFDALIDEDIERGDYIFFFWLLNDKNVYRGIEFVNRLSRMFDLPVIHSLYGEYGRYIVNNHGTMFYCSPGEFLSYIKNAAFVVTNSYHASLFSLRYERNLFISIVESMKSRFDTLFKIYEIQDCLIDDYLERGLNCTHLDYSRIKSVMKEEKKLGIVYLVQALYGG